jgi:hypothetical protein
MARVNEHYLKLKAGYLFPEIGRRVRAFAAANPMNVFSSPSSATRRRSWGTDPSRGTTSSSTR